MKTLGTIFIKCLGVSVCRGYYSLFIEGNILLNILKSYLALYFCWHFASHLILETAYYIALWFILANDILLRWLYLGGENTACKRCHNLEFAFTTVFATYLLTQHKLSAWKWVEQTSTLLQFLMCQANWLSASCWRQY